MDAHSTRVKNAAGEDFSKYKVDGLKNFLKERGIQLSDGGKGKRKAELVDLCEKAAEVPWRSLLAYSITLQRSLVSVLATCFPVWLL